MSSPLLRKNISGNSTLWIQWWPLKLYPQVKPLTSRSVQDFRDSTSTNDPESKQFQTLRLSPEGPYFRSTWTTVGSGHDPWRNVSLQVPTVRNKSMLSFCQVRFASQKQCKLTQTKSPSLVARASNAGLGRSAGTAMAFRFQGLSLFSVYKAPSMEILTYSILKHESQEDPTEQERASTDSNPSDQSYRSRPMPHAHHCRWGNVSITQ